MIEQVPVTGNPMKPTSGTYGDVKKLNDLEAQLNVPGNAGGMSQTPPPEPGVPQGMTPAPSAPGRVPDVLMGPSQMPDVPSSTPLGGPGMTAPSAVNAAQKRLAILQALSQSPTVSEETREWVSDVLDKLASRQRQ